MKILFITHRTPYPPSDGARVRAFHCLQHLHRQGHEVTVVSMARDDEEMRYASEMVGLCCTDFIVEQINPSVQKMRMVGRLFTSSPSSMGYFYSAKLEKRIRAAAQPGAFDLIYVYCSSIAPYVANINHTPLFMDFVDMDSQKWLDYARFMRFPKSWGYWLEGTKLAAAEARFAKQCDMNTVITPGELDTLKEIAPSEQNDWFSNGVNDAFLQPQEMKPEPETLVFIGRMDYYPNIEAMVRFSADVLPLILAERPKIQLLIVGADPSPEVIGLGDHPSITVTGSVPDVQPYLQRATISIAPLNIARGLQNKIIEAMALGVPVISSGLSARGVDADVGKHLLTADSPKEWKTAIIQLLDDPQRRGQLIEAAQGRVLSHHGWPAIMKKFDRLIEQCITHHKTDGR